MTKQEYLNQVSTLLAVAPPLEGHLRRQVLWCYIQGWSPQGAAVHVRHGLQAGAVEVVGDILARQ